MWEDPIVAEIRQIREEYAAKFNYDLKAIVQDIQRQERESGREYVSLSSKRSASQAESVPMVRDEAVRVGQ